MVENRIAGRGESLARVPEMGKRYERPDMTAYGLSEVSQFEGAATTGTLKRYLGSNWGVTVPGLDVRPTYGRGKDFDPRLTG